MKLALATLAVLLMFAGLRSATGLQPPAPKKKNNNPPPIEATAEQRRQIQTRLAELDGLLATLRQRQLDAALLADVEVFAKAGHWSLEFPGFYDQQDIANAIKVMETGLERARLLLRGESPWAAAKGRKVHGFHSELDGSVQPYVATIPQSYDGTRPARLYVWLHGRNNRLTEASFIAASGNTPAPASTAWTSDQGQITIDVYGRGNNANHWAGEVDIFEAIADVKKRYRIDEQRTVLRGFSLGGAAAWHIALQHPSRFVAAEIGAGTWPRRATMASQFPPYQAAPLHIWENITDWALNAFNIAIAAHDGDSDPQVASIPPPDAGTPTRGQLESSLRVRAQLEKEGFPSLGEPNDWKARSTPSVFFISANTGHAISPEVRRKVDAHLKKWGDHGLKSPDEIRFLTYTTRYNQSHWVTLDALAHHYERAEVHARRTDGGRQYDIATKNLTRLTLRETEQARTIRIDGVEVGIKPSPSVTLEKSGSRWRLAAAAWPGLHKTHALQGPIDDAFLDPFLLVRPSGTPWNAKMHEEALRILTRFDRAYARNYRAHPRVKSDRDVTPDDFQKYHVVLFGDPGSNPWIAKALNKLPLQWNRKRIKVSGKTFDATSHLPVLIYPSPFSSGKYIVINSGLTIEEREYNSDYSMPRLGDIAVLRGNDAGELPQTAWAALFGEDWKFTRR